MPDQPRQTRPAGGFTLTEMLVVLVIIGLLVGLVGPRVVGYLSGARSDTARIQIEQLSTAVELFLIDAGRLPTTEEGLTVLVKAPAGAQIWNGPYLKKAVLPLDPWGNPYRYVMDRRTGEFDIISLGADKAVGGTGEDADVSR